MLGMLRATKEAAYLVRKGLELMVVEVLRTPDGKAFVAVHKTFNGSYRLKKEESKKWDLLELDEFKNLKDSEVDYKSLPADVRNAISSAFKY